MVTVLITDACEQQKSTVVVQQLRRCNAPPRIVCYTVLQHGRWFGTFYPSMNDKCDLFDCSYSINPNWLWLLCERFVLVPITVTILSGQSASSSSVAPQSCFYSNMRCWTSARSAHSIGQVETFIHFLVYCGAP